MKTDLVELKQTCPMPELMDRIGLGQYAKPSCKPPLREDANPSFGIYQASSGDWLFKDYATGESGDELHLLARHLGRNVDEALAKLELKPRYDRISRGGRL